MVIPFQPDHYARIKLQPHQAGAVSFVSDEYVQILSQSGPCISIIHGDEIIASGGVAKFMNHSGVLWGFISENAGKHMVTLDKITRRFLSAVNLVRVEATVEKGFIPGCRWLELLGFEYEGVMRKYAPNGADHLRYARLAWPHT